MPLAVAVAVPELGTEVAEIERGVNRAVAACQYGGDGIAEEMRIDDVPIAVATRQLEQALAGTDVQPIRHAFLLQPPDSAWKM